MNWQPVLFPETSYQIDSHSEIVRTKLCSSGMDEPRTSLPPFKPPEILRLLGDSRLSPQYYSAYPVYGLGKRNDTE
jgi:hypothetical protein